MPLRQNNWSRLNLVSGKNASNLAGLFGAKHGQVKPVFALYAGTDRSSQEI
jgi:hypothetical protein